MVEVKRILEKNKRQIFFVLWATHGGIALVQFLGQKGFLDAFSLPHLLIVSFLCLWIAANLIFLVLASKGRLKGLLSPDLPGQDGILWSVAWGVAAIRCGLWLLRSLVNGELAALGAYLDLIKPILDMMGFISLEIVLFLMVLNSSRFWEDKALRSFAYKLVVVCAALTGLALFISHSRLGIDASYKGDWQRGLPAVPLLEWQIALACLLGGAIAFIEKKKWTVNFPRIDLVICCLVWLFAAVLWLSQPIIPNASALKPHEPNFEIYPFGDAQTYDAHAQSILVGNGLGRNEIPQRPLYIVFLAVLHTLVGQNYGSVINLQSLVWAIFPVLLYIFGKEFLGRPVGIAVALLAILRDYTSNLVSPFTGNLTYSKLYLSEIPTAIFLLLFLLIGLRWIKTGFPLFLGFLMGGVLGMGMLIRTQSIAALPVVLLFAVTARPRMFQSIIRSSFVMGMSLVLVVSPWLWRNWQISGELMFDNPASQTANLALRYGRLNGVEADIVQHKDETGSEYNARILRFAKDAFLVDPQQGIAAIGNYFLNHGVNNILLFPLRNDLQSFRELYAPSQAFWETWEGNPTKSQSVILIGYLFLFGLGVTTAWQRNGWLGFLPLGLNLLYNLWTSIALLSGQRFMVSMDWSVYLYYMIGLLALLGWIVSGLKSGYSILTDTSVANIFSVDGPVKMRWTSYLSISALFLLVGLSLPLSERVFPERYPLQTQEQLFNDFTSTPEFLSKQIPPSCLMDTMRKNNLILLNGRALYPRYYLPGDGESFTDTPGYKSVDEGRMVFDVVGQFNGRVIFPSSTMPEFFPGASDVTLILNGDTAWFVQVEQNGTRALYISDLFSPVDCQ